MALELNCFLKVELNKVEHVGDSIMYPFNRKSKGEREGEKTSKKVGKMIDQAHKEMKEMDALKIGGKEADIEKKMGPEYPLSPKANNNGDGDGRKKGKKGFTR